MDAELSLLPLLLLFFWLLLLLLGHNGFSHEGLVVSIFECELIPPLGKLPLRPPAAVPPNGL